MRQPISSTSTRTGASQSDVRRMCRSSCALALLLLILAPTRGLAGSISKDEETGSATGDEIGILQLITAAESDYFRAQGRYATFEELIQSGQIQRTSTHSSDYSRALQSLQLQTDSQPVAGFTLNLLVSSSGSRFHLSLTLREGKCGVGWFTDEAGVLYQGKAVNCAEHMTAPLLKSWPPANVDAGVPPVQNDGLCPLPQILHEASERASELVGNLQRFTATEQIEHTEFGKNGKHRGSTSELFSYVAEMEENPSGEFWVNEYRTAESQSQSDPPRLVENATAASGLIFHPKMIGDFEIHCEGQTDLQGMPAWQLRFEERPNPSKSFSEFLINGTEHPVRLKGRAWISADNYQVLRLQRDLVAPVPEINLQFEHSDISYAPVEFANHRISLWLPKIVSMDIGYRGHHYQRVHSFSHFQVFLVDTEERVKEPAPAAPNSGLTSDSNPLP
jgi:hypothetical protein